MQMFIEELAMFAILNSAGEAPQCEDYNSYQPQTSHNNDYSWGYKDKKSNDDDYYDYDDDDDFYDNSYDEDENEQPVSPYETCEEEDWFCVFEEEWKKDPAWGEKFGAMEELEELESRDFLIKWFWENGDSNRNITAKELLRLVDENWEEISRKVKQIEEWCRLDSCDTTDEDYDSGDDANDDEVADEYVSEEQLLEEQLLEDFIKSVLGEEDYPPEYPEQNNQEPIDYKEDVLLIPPVQYDSNWID